MKVRVVTKILNNLERTVLYKTAEDIDAGRKIAMKSAKEKPYDTFIIYSMKSNKMLGGVQYSKVYKRYYWISAKRGVKNRIIRKDGTLGGYVG